MSKRAAGDNVTTMAKNNKRKGGDDEDEGRGKKAEVSTYRHGCRKPSQIMLLCEHVSHVEIESLAWRNMISINMR